MHSPKKQHILAQFRTISGVGKSIAQDLWNIGLRSLDDLNGQDPEQLYQLLCQYQKCKVDRCMLYVMRCAVYFVSEKKPSPELLKWWNWKD